jgi:hypothetical protein
MARSLAAAIAAVEGPEFDEIVGYAPRLPRASSTPDGLRRAFEGFDYAHIDGIARRLTSRYRCAYSDAEEAVHDALEELIRKRPEVFARGREMWLAFLYGASRFRLFDRKASAGFFESLETLEEAGGDAALAGSHPLLPTVPGEAVNGRPTLPPGPGERWSGLQMVGALQRFHERHGRPPRARECKPLLGLPSIATFRREFGSFSNALQAAGMLSPTAGLRRKPWTALEAAEACISFRWRNSRWPDAADASRRPGELPSRSVMIRFFGGTRAAEVQQGAESILGMT